MVGSLPHSFTAPTRSMTTITISKYEGGKSTSNSPWHYFKHYSHHTKSVFVKVPRRLNIGAYRKKTDPKIFPCYVGYSCSYRFAQLQHVNEHEHYTVRCKISYNKFRNAFRQSRSTPNWSAPYINIELLINTKIKTWVKKQSWPNLRYYAGICTEKLWNTRKDS
jgi:hypothetical protein